ncbi:glycoside hydrolase family 18 protein [Photobacterium aphoticum]|uniref:chitinase n=1 Tax=Photobacterium aphoticum TaxID=754436 RepID=A0A0J1GHX1_9GAMM|nr:glycoside hydrolase family 18 protein [Photobacterium aphoticum]KLU99170.1 hypothetical protein ABT58_19385 [Photobacterium aphoticum]PSU59040.1 hypothetical protein C9I90_04595 [Photobacterium aphoticum]GHA45041.1 hypothetical protein GCM10007086_18200 [Photobacterium aphoticum]
MNVLTPSWISLALLCAATSVSAVANDTFIPPQTDHDFFSGEFQHYQQSSGKVVATYIGNWVDPSVVADINGDNLTHLIYAFVEVCGEQQRDVLDEVCKNIADHRLAVSDNTVDTTFIAQFEQLKQLYPHLKILLSIGGGGRSATFTQMVASEAHRQTFINSTLDYLAKYPVFDGIDIDWEYPLTAEEGNGFALLMADLNAGLATLEQRTQRQYINSAAVNTIDYLTQFVNYREVAPHTDLIFLMTYDLFGSWFPDNIGHHTNLQSHPNNVKKGHDHSVNRAVEKFIDMGVPADKLVIGVAKYARGWQGVTPPDKGGPFGTAATELFPLATQPGDESGVITYATLYDTLLGKDGKGRDGFEIRYNADCACHYAWRQKDGAFVTFDHPYDVYQKGRYAVKHKLAGVFSWAYQQDNGDVLNAMNEGVGNTPYRQK